VTYKKQPDYYYRLAREKSWVARSIFKLEEIDKKTKLIKPADFILDLGASPGSWMQYTLSRIGNRGRIVGIDLVPPSIKLPSNATFIVANIFEISPEEIINKTEIREFDVVLSDLAPKTTGIKFADQENSYLLFLRSFEISKNLLKQGGNFAGKLFFSQHHNEAEKILRLHFSEVKTIHPRATRKESSEIFLVGKNFLKTIYK